MLDSRNFEKAIETLQAGLASYPAEPQLTEWLDRARKAEAEEMRRRAIRKAIAAATTLIEKQQYDAAISALGKEQKRIRTPRSWWTFSDAQRKRNPKRT